MKRILIACGLVALTAAAAQAQLNTFNRFEISLTGGLGLHGIPQQITNYEDIWGNYIMLDVFHEWTDIYSDIKKSGLSLAGGLTYYLSPNLGIQIAASYYKVPITTTSDMNIEFTWIDNTGDSGSDTIIDDTGSLQIIPISLNLVGRFGNDQFSGYLSGGPTLFLTNLKAYGTFAYGFTSIRNFWQYADAMAVGLNVENKWTGFGGNIGGGFTYTISPSLGLTVDARYFLCPAIQDAVEKGDTVYWYFATGDYDGYFFGEVTGLPFEDADIDIVLANNPMDFGKKINPSFFQITAGIKFSFGGF